MAISVEHKQSSSKVPQVVYASYLKEMIYTFSLQYLSLVYIKDCIRHVYEISINELHIFD